MKIIGEIAESARRNSIEQWCWRSFMITLVINQAIGPLIGLLLWTAVLPDSAAVRTYFVILIAVQLLTVSHEDHTLGNSIFDGTIVDRLLLPIPVLADVLGSNLAVRFWHTAFGLPIIVGVGFAVGLRPEPVLLLTAVPAIILAGALRFCLTVSLAMTAFWTERAGGLVALGGAAAALLGGLAAPLFLLSPALAGWGRWLPFWPMLGLPAEIAAGVLAWHEVWQGYLAQVGWLVIMVVITQTIWRRGLRVFTAVGA